MQRFRLSALKTGLLQMSLMGVVTTTVGCSSVSTLTVRPTTPAQLELTPAPQLTQRQYKRILLLAPEQPVRVVEGIEAPVVVEKDTRYYVTQLEKVLLAKGFSVVSSEIVARAGTAPGLASRSAAERALIMGKQTEADAVLAIQSVSVQGGEKFYHIKDLSEVEQGKRLQDKKGNWLHRDTEECLYRLPYYEVRLEAKLIDVQNGDVLWVGAGRGTSLDVLPESWVVKLDEDCGVKEQQPFVYSEYLATESALDKTVHALLVRLIEPLREKAFTAKAAPKEPPPPPPVAKVEPPPPPPPPVVEPPPPPPKKMAVVSGTRSQLREGPETRSRRILVVPRKAKVEVLDTMGEWLKVKAQDGSTGWMHEKDLILPD